MGLGKKYSKLNNPVSLQVRTTEEEEEELDS